MVLFAVYCKYRNGILEQSELIACAVLHVSQTVLLVCWFKKKTALPVLSKITNFSALLNK